MSQDGADLGYTPEQGMRGAMGGEQPARTMSVAELDEYLSAAPATPTSYDDAARIAARIFREYLLTHPEARNLEANDEGAWTNLADDGTLTAASEYRPVKLGLYSTVRNSDPALAKALRDLDLTGFQVGWAVNAARRVCELAPVANPAIITIGGAG